MVTFSLFSHLHLPPSYLCSFILLEGLSLKRCCPKAPQASVPWSSGQLAPLAMGATAMMQGSHGALELLGKDVLYLNHKTV